MSQSIRFFLSILCFFSLFFISGCKKKVSNVSITALTGTGRYIAGGPNWDAMLRIYVTLSNQGEADATITDWVAEIKEGNTVVITISKNSPGDYQPYITPDPTTTYTVSAGSTFDFNLNRTWMIKVPDPYGGMNPSSIKMTITVQDEKSSYNVELTSSFTFVRF